MELHLIASQNHHSLSASMNSHVLTKYCIYRRVENADIQAYSDVNATLRHLHLERRRRREAEKESVELAEREKIVGPFSFP